jgi:catechol 2,3-dioxygenase-like lactoylglutathione lyase family enzyme
MPGEAVVTDQTGDFQMAKIRHIAIRAEDVEATAKLFTEVFGLELVQRRAHGPIDLSDGDVNITLLPVGLNGNEEGPGYSHIGFTAENTEEIHQRLMDHGASELNPVMLGDAYYESKYESTEGLVIDVGHWRGASPIDAGAVESVKA